MGLGLTYRQYSTLDHPVHGLGQTNCLKIVLNPKNKTNLYTHIQYISIYLSREKVQEVAALKNFFALFHNIFRRDLQSKYNPFKQYQEATNAYTVSDMSRFRYGWMDGLRFGLVSLRPS